MCSYKVLFHKASGYVVKCNSCAHYQIAFGTMVFTISEENMDSMYEDVKKSNSDINQAKRSHNERVQVRMPCESVMMALNSKELNQFQNMIEEAFATEELKKILLDVNIG